MEIAADVADSAELQGGDSVGRFAILIPPDLTMLPLICRKNLGSRTGLADGVEAFYAFYYEGSLAFHFLGASSRDIALSTSRGRPPGGTGR
jgi:hypothetical protein